MLFPDHRLLLLGPEPACRPLARSLRLLCPVETRALSAPAPRMLEQPTAILTKGVGFRERAMIRQAELALRPFLDRTVPVLCLLDEPSPRDEAQAYSIGASAVLPAHSPTQRVADHLRTLLGGGEGSGRSDLHRVARAKVQAVGFALAELMDAAACGATVDHAVATRAARLLSGAVVSDGIANWMWSVSQMHDPTYLHCLMMAGIMGAFTLRLGINEADCNRMIRAAILHDVGKALIPVAIIDKATALTDAEMAIVRRHPTDGHALLLDQGGHDDITLDVVRHHHEYLDGSGYPDGLRDSQISDAVRIATLSDVFAALIEPRSYKPSLSATEAFGIMQGMAGKLDPALLRAFGGIFVPA